MEENETVIHEKEIDEAVRFLMSKNVTKPDIGIILGTGLGGLFTKEIVNPMYIDYSIIPHFSTATVELHKGKLVYGEIGNKKILAMWGRFHFYEGHSMWKITLPVRVMKMLGIQHLLISNAAGKINLKWNKGDLMLLNDHINLQPDNPLRGSHSDSWGSRFPDMSRPYSEKLNTALKQIAKENNIVLREGVYACVSGPNLETRAEYRFLQNIGADAVGMSTVPEIIVANQIQLPCCAVSVLTDDCNPDHLQPVSIPEVIATAAKTEPALTALYTALIKKI